MKFKNVNRPIAGRFLHFFLAAGAVALELGNFSRVRFPALLFALVVADIKAEDSLNVVD